MAAPTTPGLTPSEVAFLAEHELVEVIPRQRLDGLQLLGGPTPALVPPRRASLPLWLALLLKRQQRANISAPAWLRVDSLIKILELETELGTERGFTASVAHPTTGPGEVPVSGPFIPGSSSSTSSNNNSNSNKKTGGMMTNDGDMYDNDEDNEEDFLREDGTGEGGTSGRRGGGAGAGGLKVALPYHWLEMAHLILTGAADDVPEADAVRRLVRDLRETRAAKMRDAVIPALQGGREARVTGVGALEVAEHRLFVAGVVDGLRKIGASKEASRRDREEEEGGAMGADDSDDDDLMGE